MLVCALAATNLDWGPPLGWPVLTGLVGLAGTGAADDAIEELTEKVRRFTAGERDVEFTTDRDDAVGRLYDAVGSLAATVQRNEAAVTERERDRPELERYKQFTEDLLDAVDDVFYVVDREGTLLWWNDRLNEVLGMTDEEIAALEPLDTVAESDREDMVRAMQEAWETGSVRHEARYVSADGHSEPHELVASVLENPEGKEVLAGIGRDITERKRYERELRIEKEHFRSALENSPLIAFRMDTDLRYTWIHKLRDLKLDSVIGKRDDEVFPPETAAMLMAPKREVLDTGEGTREEVTFDLPRGEVTYDMMIEPLYDECGEIRGLTCVALEITERKQRQRELEWTKELLEQTQRIAEIGGWTTDMREERERHETEWTGKMFDIFELSTDEPPLAEEVMDFYHPDDRAERLADARRAIEDGEGWDAEARLLTAKGNLRWVRTVGEPVVEDGEVTHLYGAVQDITERKERERELERTKDMLEQSQRLAHVGAWELTVREDGPELTMTEESYRIHELPVDADLDLERAFGFYHPDDRQRIRDLVERAVEHGEGYDAELRLITANGNERWVRAIADPVREDGDVVAVRGAILDITEQKEREDVLRSLHETARGLLQTETDDDVVELVVETATEVLDVPGVAVYLLDDDRKQLVPVGTSDGFDALVGGASSVAVGDDDSLVWTVFADGERAAFDEGGSPGPFDEDLVGLVVPIGEHGVFVATTEADGRIDDEARRVIETLVATTEAAFDRIESEGRLRERDAELRAQNRRLQRQMQITEIIRRIDQSLVGATSQEEIERAVCDRLVEVDDVAFAWIGQLDANGTRLSPRTWAGQSRSYLNAISLEVGNGATEPATVTARTGEPTAVVNVVDGLQREDWRKRALATGYRSVVSVPLSFEEYTYGVLTVYADEPAVFDELERTVFAELGRNIANAINAVQTREALHADRLLELTFTIPDSDDLFAQIARECDCEVTYRGLAAQSPDETRLFIATTGATAAAVERVLDGLAPVVDARRITEREGQCLFEVTLSDGVLPAMLVRHGASPREIQATKTETTVVVDVPTTTDVREFVDLMRGRFPAVELAGRRDVERPTGTEGELVSSLLDGLTDRQLEVLRTAYYAGFFEWPRQSTGEDVAEMLGVTQPTINRHFRLAQQRLLSRLFDKETAAVTGA